jgi:hypothetical protein
MPLPAPILDNRTWQQLRDELVGRIPVYAPEWSDVSPSDPGVTILELLAFLGENLLFRFNQIPESTNLHLLRLLEVPLRPAQPARGTVTFTLPFDPSQAFVLPVVERGLVSVMAGAVGFEVQDDVAVLPVAVRGAVKQVVHDLPAGEQALVAERAIDARDGLKPGETAAYYKAVVVGDDTTAASAEAVDAGSSVDHSLWIAVLAPEADPEVTSKLLHPAGPLGNDPLNPGRGAVLSLGFALPSESPAMIDVDPCFGAAGRDQGIPPQVEWRVTKGLLGADGEPEYITVDPVGDTTWGLTRDGVVRLRLPARMEEVGVPQPVDPFLAGTGDLPPVLDDEPPVLFWVRAFAPAGAPLLGSFRWVGANAASVVQWRTASAEYVGTGTGQPGQSHALAQRDVLADSLRVQVEEKPEEWRDWERVESFTASGRDDRHYVLDGEAGTVTFGDTVRGLAPQRGDRIRALEYRYGGGQAGNVPAGVVKQIVEDAVFAGPPVAGTVSVGRAGAVTATNPLPFRGGADAEDVADGLRRIPGELRRRDRAVTASDFRELALSTPGGLVGRAECLPLFHRRQPFVEAAGVVTVVVWPSTDPLHPDAPVPDRGVLKSVCEFLDARRLVTTELYVVPPEYVGVAVSVSFEPKPGASPDAVRRWVEQVIRQYLSPMPPYGPEGEGWPLGRTVRAAELEAAALQVEGVLYLNGVSVARLSEDGTSWVQGTVRLEKWQSVECKGVVVVAGGPVPVAGAGLDTPALPPGSRPVPIPLPPDVC